MARGTIATAAAARERVAERGYRRPDYLVGDGRLRAGSRELARPDRRRLVSSLTSACAARHHATRARNGRGGRERWVLSLALGLDAGAPRGT